MNKNTKDVAFTGIYIGLILGVGYALAFIPNVELVTSMVFNFVINWKSNPVNYLIIGSLGILLTIIYDIMVSIAFPIAAGFNVKAIAITLVTGVAFSAIHIFTNALVFIFIIPVTAQKVYSAIPYFREISNSK